MKYGLYMILKATVVNAVRHTNRIYH